MLTRSAEDFLLASKRCEIANLEQLLLTGELVAEISQLVHLLQRERGLSNVFLASAGARFASQRLEQVQACQEMEERLRQRLEVLDLGACHLSGHVRLYTCVAHVLHGLEALPAIRQRALTQQITAPELTRVISTLIAGLLSVVFEAADTSADPDITRILVAKFNFMQGKELAGQERAWGASGFAAGYFTAEDQQKLQHLIEAQARCFEVFENFSPDQPLSAWRSLQQHTCVTELNRLRQIVARAGHQEAVPSAFSEVWYDVATCRIDVLKGIEEGLADALLQLCRHKLKAARQDLQTHRFMLDSLAGETAESASLRYLTDSVQLTEPTAGRSVYDLLQAQSVRLQVVSDELQQARQALTERKVLERAKGLLMEYQGLTEAEAYRQLRQSAMEQNLRLQDVAELIIERTRMLLR